jgi:TonB-linked SusC/RagA family outer membrane protein
VTDDAGAFTIAELPDGPVTLRFRLIGYRPESLEVPAGQNTVQMTLHATAVNLEEVVVTGTAGATQKRQVGNAVATISAADQVQLAPVADVSQLINARAPGVIVNSGPGMAGSGSRIRIRGRASISLASDPLIYVDGVRVDNSVGLGSAGQGRNPARGARSDIVSRLNDIDPEQIESIEIIKGPAAATLYGTEAANGVIQIITKRGNGTPQFGFHAAQGASWFNDLESRWPIMWARDPVTNELITQNFAAEQNAKGTPLFQTGRTQGYGANLSGSLGTQTNYFLGVDYNHDESAKIGSYNETFSGRLNLSIAARPNLDINASAALVTGHLESPGGFELPVYPATLPLWRDSVGGGEVNNIPASAYRKYSSSMYDVDRYTTSVKLEYRTTPWLTQRLTTGLDLTQDSKSYLQPRLSAELQPFFGPWGYYSQVGSKTVTPTDSRYTTVDYSATASFFVRENVKSSTTVGAQYYRKQYDMAWRRGRVFPSREITAISAAGETDSWDDFIENTTFGGFVQEQIGWNDRVFLTAAVRADDNSAFGSNFDAVIYPKVSGSWVMSEEPFWNVSWVNTFRLRAAWGASGQQPDAYSATRTYSAVTGRDGASVLQPGAPGNPDLKPERSQEFEGGFEAGLFGDRLGVDFTVYNKTTSDALVLRNVAPSTGYATGDGLEGEQWVNGGKIRNRGVELTLNGRVMDSHPLRWEMQLGGSVNDNKLLELSTGQEFLTVDYLQNRYQPGYPLDAFFRKHIVAAELDGAGKVIPSSMMCDDGNGGSVLCTDAPQVYRGRPDPKYAGSFSNTFTIFERLKVFALVDFKAGHRLWNVNRWVACGAFYQTCEVNYSPEKFSPTWVAEVQTDPTLYAWETIEDASYAKLREVSVSYSLPTRLANRVGASQASLTLSGHNLHTWTKYSGFDPEGGVLSHRNLAEEDQTIPPLRSVQLTLRMSF